MSERDRIRWHCRRGLLELDIVLARFLDRQYTVWGRVIEGMENVDRIARGEPAPAPDRMVSVRVAADAAS